jgi:GH18 family chitinase
MLLLGGDFPALETGAGVLDTLLANLSTFIHQYGYGGLDIDWEYPSRQSGFWINALARDTGVAHDCRRIQECAL